MSDQNQFGNMKIINTQSFKPPRCENQLEGDGKYPSEIPNTDVWIHFILYGW